jgi:hypothetical protein
MFQQLKESPKLNIAAVFDVWGGSPRKTAGFNLHANALALATAERVGLRDNEILRVSVKEERRAIKAPLKPIATKDFAPPERSLVRPCRF